MSANRSFQFVISTFLALAIGVVVSLPRAEAAPMANVWTQTDGWPADIAAVTSKSLGTPGKSKVKITTVIPAAVEAGVTGLTITVTGQNFTTDTRVVLSMPGAMTATSNASSPIPNADLIIPTKYVSATQLTADMPPSLLRVAGKIPMRVSNGYDDGLSDPAVTLQVTPPSGRPVLRSIVPLSTVADAHKTVTVTLWGQNFDKDSVVAFGKRLLAANLVSTSQMVVALPRTMSTEIGVFEVGVINNKGASEKMPFQITKYPVQDASSPEAAASGTAAAYFISPTSKPVGGDAFTLTVGGANFPVNAKVTANGSPVTTTFVSSEELGAAIPATLLSTAA